MAGLQDKFKGWRDKKAKKQAGEGDGSPVQESGQPQEPMGYADEPVDEGYGQADQGSRSYEDPYVDINNMPPEDGSETSASPSGPVSAEPEDASPEAHARKVSGNIFRVVLPAVAAVGLVGLVIYSEFSGSAGAPVAAPAAASRPKGPPAAAITQDTDTGWLDKAKVAVSAAAASTVSETTSIGTSTQDPAGPKKPTIDLSSPPDLLGGGAPRFGGGPSSMPSGGQTLPVNGGTGGYSGSSSASTVPPVDPLEAVRASKMTVFVRQSVPQQVQQQVANAQMSAALAAQAQQAQQQAQQVASARYIPGQLTPSNTPYFVRAGSTIPIALLHGINSDIPGTVSAVVTRNVFDTPTGRHLLIPQGSVLMGQAATAVSFGQTRMPIAWTRLDLPNGKYFPLSGQPTLDFLGMAGIESTVNNHYWSLMKNALLMSIVGAAATSATNSVSGGAVEGNATPTPAQQSAINMANYFGTITMSIINRGANRQPTLTVEQATKMNVGLAGDLPLEPYTP